MYHRAQLWCSAKSANQIIPLFSIGAFACTWNKIDAYYFSFQSTFTIGLLSAFPSPSIDTSSFPRSAWHRWLSVSSWHPRWVKVSLCLLFPVFTVVPSVPFHGLLLICWVLVSMMLSLWALLTSLCKVTPDYFFLFSFFTVHSFCFFRTSKYFCLVPISIPSCKFYRI
jgi:hypothetical protein